MKSNALLNVPSVQIIRPLVANPFSCVTCLHILPMLHKCPTPVSAVILPSICIVFFFYLQQSLLPKFNSAIYYYAVICTPTIVTTHPFTTLVSTCVFLFQFVIFIPRGKDFLCFFLPLVCGVCVECCACVTCVYVFNRTEPSC